MNKQTNLVEHIQQGILNAVSGKSKLNQEILLLEGMSSSRNRHLLNNILDMSNVNYLEIGVHKGSTFVSSLYQNEVDSAYAIDNWSEFNDNNPKTCFLKNCANYNITNFTFLESDSFKLDLDSIKHKINVYFYDGDHSVESTCNALTYYYDILDNEFIFIVDDYDWPNVQKGTKIGIENCKLNIIYEQQLKADFCGDNNTWWNGLYISILKL